MRPWHWNDRPLVVGFALGASILLAVTALSYHEAAAVSEAFREVTLTRDIVLTLQELEEALLEAETAQRGFVLTGDPRFLAPFDHAGGAIESNFARLPALLALEHPQLERVRALRTRIDTKLAFMRRAVATQRAEGQEEAVALVRTGEGLRLMEALQAQITALASHQTDLLNQKAGAAQASAKRAIHTVLAGVPVSLLLLGLVFAALRHEVFERRRAEQALRESEARTRSIIDNMVGGLITVDAHGVIESLNPAAEHLFGYARAELIGQHVSLLAAEPASTDAQEFVRGAFPEALGRITEWHGRRKGGEPFPLELSVFEFQGGDGRHFAGNVRDISERREIERLKQEFVATVSHELRTPLTSILGSLSLLAHGALGELPSDGRELLAIAERNAVRLMGLINDILDLERLRSGRLELRSGPVPLRALAERSFEAVRGLAASGGVPIQVDVAGGQAHGDFDRLVQVLVNLLSNAVKFSPRGAPVRISAVELDGEVELCVSDSGRGIPAEMRESIFERFTQVEASDSRRKGGSGLGLAICKAIVEQHGGRIGVESGPGRGCRFWFRVPSRPAAGGGPAGTEAPGKSLP